MNLEARLLQPLDHLQPLGPNRIDQHIQLMRLNQKRRVSNPGYADFAFPNLWEVGPHVIACSLGKERWYQDCREEISLMPVGMGPQLYPGRMLILGTVLGGLTNHVSAAFS